MVTEKIGNLLEGDVDVIVHQANLFHTFGAGIAAAIKKVFPEAYAADCATVNADINKLGTISVGQIKNPHNQIKAVANLYSQSGIGGKDRQTTYDAMVTGLHQLHERLMAAKGRGKVFTLGIPWHMGCGLANGDWTIVRAIIEAEFGKSPINVIIYQRPEDVTT